MAISPIETVSAPKAIGPYSQAIKTSGSGRLVFVSGQIPLDPKTGALVEGGVEVQTKRVLDNLKAVVDASGGSMKTVVKTTIFLKDMNDFQKVNEIYAAYFAQPYPARATVQVSRLPRDVAVEIDCVVEV